MFTAFGQENLTHVHHTNAANKPLNQTIRALQPKTPGAVSKTPFRARNDENAPLNTGKAAKNAFVTPGPVPQTTKRAPLGAKTTNAKGGAFQTPAPGQKLRQTDQTANKPSSTARRSTKKKIYVESEPVTEPAAPEAEGEEDDEPDFGYAPPPIVPLPDPPIDFEGITYEALRPENFNRGVREIYFHSPKDENGFSIALKKQEELYKKSLENDLARTLEDPERQDPDEEMKAMIRAGPKRMKPVPESKLNTIKARSASAALSHSTAPRTHQRLPSAATRETAASKQKRKAAFAVSRDENAATSTMPKPVSRSTIGFPKAKKPASILPQTEPKRSHERPSSRATAHRAQKEEDDQTIDQNTISPRKFVQLYGEPPVESEMWFRLMELEIKDRHRGEDEEVEAGIFDVELDDDLDQKLGVHFEGQDVDDFELTL